MNFEVVDFREQPEEVCQRSYDCIWVWFKNRRAPSPIENPLMQWIDWRMQGVLSRFVVEKSGTSEKTTFLPTMSRIASTYVALEPPSAKWDQILRNCEGLNFHKVLFVVEDDAKRDQVKAQLSKHKKHAFPEVVSVAEPLGNH